MLANRLNQKKIVRKVGEQEWLGNALIRSYSPSQRARRGRERMKQKALHYGIEDFICSSSFVDIETFYAG